MLLRVDPMAVNGKSVRRATPGPFAIHAGGFGSFALSYVRSLIAFLCSLDGGFLSFAFIKKSV